MDGNQIFMLGLGLQAPWKIVDQHLDTSQKPNQLRLRVSADRGSLFPCPKCGKACPTHDFKELTWQHLNFFQHHCYITAKVPRTTCEEHGTLRVNVPWARENSKFTLLFEQALLSLVREMPVKACAKHIGVNDKRIWRVIKHYVSQALLQMDLSSLKAIGLDETASKRGHNYVTVFIDMDRHDKPVIFATTGKGKGTIKEFRAFLEKHGGQADNVLEVVCDMSKAFLAAVKEELPQANVTVDWFHVVQLFTRAVDDVRKEERKLGQHPKSLRWAVLKKADGPLTEKQVEALAELESSDLKTGIAWRIKEKLRWIRKAKTAQAARWRLTHFIKYAKSELGECEILVPVRKALSTVESHADKIIQRWSSTYTNARMEGLNSLFQAARSRARGYRNTGTFLMMIYMIASPVADLLKSI
ncbi:ISL3 family transposase [Endozoicomonas gorgoniicola]|uniref:ISL3 family transposase n=1 Tax=Endozoicomonas gorgoniicola TaxID=1234144 RepID=A0ABT3MQJ0_9GAMM|nr:ISL3 family transposase [Endozoicomonas gorgoniicola]MCW7551646.1 ISL3 family transposase [Endozoicomonas gorgoniicola]MCW7552622.1 ISL3 family transposase [Endozoicomonas gorgoniicola]